MIFDTPQMQRLRTRYADIPDYKVPRIVFLDRYDGWANERQYLEEVISSVPASKQKVWLGHLLNKDDAQFLGGWFEMLLVEWLEQLGPVIVEPEYSNSLPDFMVNVDGRECYIEARAIVKRPEERIQCERDAELFTALQTVALPYEVTIKKFQQGDTLDTRSLVKSVENWLRDSPDSAFVFENRGNVIKLCARLNPKLKTIGIVGPMRSFWANPLDLRRPLQEKALKYKSLSLEGKAYVIAILLESYRYTAEEVGEAWFGRPSVIVDLEQDRIVEETLDGSGLHFLGSEVRHKSISGTLVFRARPDDALGRHVLHGAYIQNPFASQSINPTVFPVASRFVVLDKNERHYRMDWVSNS
jgi:hypothetical protein